MGRHPLTLTVICERINVHLRRFERDPSINVPKPPRGHGTQQGLTPYHHAGCVRTGNKAAVRYVSFQHTHMLDRHQAEAYLRWLDEGNVGKHMNLPKGER